MQKKNKKIQLISLTLIPFIKIIVELCDQNYKSAKFIISLILFENLE